MALELIDLAVGYKNKVSLSGVNLTSSGGEFIALIGPNGAGKTTLLKTIAGLRKPLSGTVSLDGYDAAHLDTRRRARLVSFLFQGNVLQTSGWGFTVRELVEQGRFYMRGLWGRGAVGDHEIVDEALAEAGLSDFAETPVTELSGGELQRALIARTIAQGAEILLLDEPTNNLDPKYAFLVMELVKKLTRKGLTALVSTHDLALASSHADRACVAAFGRLETGLPSDMLHKDRLREIFGFFSF